MVHHCSRNCRSSCRNGRRSPARSSKRVTKKSVKSSRRSPSRRSRRNSASMVDPIDKCGSERLKNRQLYNQCQKQISKLQHDLDEAHAKIEQLNKGMTVCRTLTAKKSKY